MSCIHVGTSSFKFQCNVKCNVFLFRPSSELPYKAENGTSIVIFNDSGVPRHSGKATNSPYHRGPAVPRLIRVIMG